MSKSPESPRNTGLSDSIGEAFSNFLDSVARFLFWAGLVLTVIAVGFLIFTALNAGSTGTIEQAKSNADLFGKILVVGLIGVFVGSTYMFWGEDVMAALQVIGAILLFFGAPFLSMALSGGQVNPGSEAAIGAIRSGGAIFGICALFSLTADIVVRVRFRMQQGAKADLLKYGKGIKEERDIQNVFMGSCWQLPFCRKFVRERCPIYHSRRTCWKEQVGCMCEEEVIRGAMEGRVIPKDAVAAATFIPQNNKLNAQQKFERCKQCVIYNERQKHKYKLAMPMMVGVFVLGYIALRPFLIGATVAVIQGLDKVMGKVTFGASGNVGEQITQQAIPLHEVVLVCVLIAAFAYCIKMLEYVIFKLKY